MPNAVLVVDLVFPKDRFGIDMRIVIHQLVANGAQEHEVLDVMDRKRLRPRRPRPRRAEGDDVGRLPEKACPKRQRVLEQVDVMSGELASPSRRHAQEGPDRWRDLSTNVWPTANRRLT